MQTVLYYFSGRGNSQKAAEDIAARLGDTILSPFNSLIDDESERTAPRVGFVFPVINFGVPAHLPGFLQKVAAGRPERYYFAVVLNGGMPCATLSQVERALKACHATLASGHLVDVRILQGRSGNWPALLEQIAATVEHGAPAAIQRGTLADRLLYTGLINTLSGAIIHKQDKNFWIDKNCDGCRVCLKVCPVDNILMQAGKPVWQHRCDQCFGCYAWCPQKAIHHGKKDDERLRQTNPDIHV